jgi:hypothetical protein
VEVVLQDQLLELREESPEETMVRVVEPAVLRLAARVRYVTREVQAAAEKVQVEAEVVEAAEVLVGQMDRDSLEEM